MFQNNLKIACRNLLRRRTFTTINITGLALGMAAAIFAFIWVQNELRFDRFHDRAAHLFRINADLRLPDGNVWHWATTPLPLMEAMQNGMPEVAASAALFENPWKPLTVRRDAVVFNEKKYAYVSRSWFELFDFQFLEGSDEGFHDQLHSAILTRGLAEKLYGRWDVAGETFHLDSVAFTVHAVIENHPPNSGFTQEMLLPLDFYLADPRQRENERWGNYNFLTFVELKPGADIGAVGKKLTGIVHRHNDRDGEDNVTLSVQPLADVHFDEGRSYGAMRTGSRRAVYTFAAIGLVVLLLACVNYVSLTTAQADMRTKEVGVRKIIGAGGGQVFRLLFAESLVTTACSLLLALCAVQVCMPLFNRFAEKNFELDPLDPAIWAVVVSTAALSLLLSGVYPALFLTGFSPGNFLRGQHFLKMKNSAFRKGLVVAQFAITTGLIIGAIVIYKQQDFIQKKDLGFDRSQVFEFQAPCCEGREAAVKAIQNALANEPGVVATASANASLVDVQSTHSGSLDWEGKPDNFDPTVSQMSVDAGFGSTVQLPLAEGRWFEPGHEADLKNVLLNETAVRQLGIPSPVVGQRFHFHGNEGQVIGVVKDFHYRSLRQKIEPMVIYHHPPANGNVIVKTAAGKVPQALAAAEKAWQAQYPAEPFEYRFMDDSFDELYKNEAKNTGLSQLLAGLAVFISCLGLFGLAVFSTAQRTKEIGIRKVLGASVVSVVGLLSKEFLSLVIVSLAIAAPLAYFFMEKWLQDYAYRTAIPWTVFALAGIMAVAGAIFTVALQTVKAALANPVNSLRNE